MESCDTRWPDTAPCTETEVAEMEETGDGRVVYLAINGHRMVTDQESYDRGRTWDAQHAEECPCVDDAPPNW